MSAVETAIARCERTIRMQETVAKLQAAIGDAEGAAKTLADVRRMRQTLADTLRARGAA